MIQSLRLKKCELSLIRQSSNSHHDAFNQKKNLEKIQIKNHQNYVNSAIKINKSKLPKDFFNKPISESKIQRKITLSQEVSRQKYVENNNSQILQTLNVTPLKKNPISKIDNKRSKNIFRLSTFAYDQINNPERYMFVGKKSSAQTSKGLHQIVQINTTQSLQAFNLDEDPIAIKINLRQSKTNVNPQQQSQSIYFGPSFFKSSGKENMLRHSLAKPLESIRNSLVIEHINPCQPITFYKAKSSLLPPLKVSYLPKGSTN